MNVDDGIACKSSRLWVLFFVGLLFNFMARGLILLPTFNTDDIFRIVNADVPEYYKVFLSQGRFTESLLYFVLNFAHRSPIDLYVPATISYFVLSSLIAALFLDRVAGSRRGYVIPAIGAGLIATAPMGTTLMTIKSSLLVQSLGLAGVLIFAWTLFHRPNSRYSMPITLLCTVLALSSYQLFLALLAMAALFAAVSPTGEFLANRPYLENLRGFIGGCVIYGGGFILYPMVSGTPSVAAGRGGMIHFSDFPGRLVMLIENLTTTYGTLDPLTAGAYFFLSVTCLLLAVICVRNRWRAVAFGFTILIACSILSIAPLLVLTTIWIDPRMTFAGTYALASVIVFWGVWGVPPAKVALSIVGSILVICGIAVSTRIEIDQGTLNRLDAMVANKIVSGIEAREVSGGIDEVILHNAPWSYPAVNTSAFMDRNLSALAVNFAAQNVFVLAANFTKPVTTSRNDGFCVSQSLWPSPESIVVINRTAHVCFGAD